MSVVATALERLRATVASSTSFRELTGTGTQSAALARVHEGKAPAGATRPCAIVMAPAGQSAAELRESVTTRVTRGRLAVQFELPLSGSGAVTRRAVSSLAAERLRDLIAGSARFRAWAGVVGDEAALARVHVGKAPGDAVRPLAIVVVPAEGPVEWEREGVASWRSRGGLQVVFESLAPEDVAAMLADEPVTEFVAEVVT